MFWSARASNAASGMRCSPDFSTRPEKRPIKKARARFSVSRSGKVIVIIKITSKNAVITFDSPASADLPASLSNVLCIGASILGLLFRPKRQLRFSPDCRGR
jgi:hypothetical protein